MVGKGHGGEPPIDLDTMLDLTAAAEVEGVRFDGFDLFLFEPHVNIDSGDDEITAAGRQGPAAEPGDRHGGGAGLAADRRRLGHGQRRRPAAVSSTRSTRAAASPSGCASWACGPTAWCGSTRPAAWKPGAKTPSGNQQRIADTFRQACTIAEDHGERLAAEGEICWGGMHSWQRMLQLLEMVDRPQTLGFQADMAHTLLYLLGYNAPEDALLPHGFRLERPATLRRRPTTR